MTLGLSGERGGELARKLISINGSNRLLVVVPPVSCPVDPLVVGSIGTADTNAVMCGRRVQCRGKDWSEWVC